MIRTLNKKAVAPKRAIAKVKKKFTKFRSLVLTRHPSHSALRRELPLLPFRSVVRLGSTTRTDGRIECNSIEGVKNSSSKLLMKQCFTRAGVKTADWWIYNTGINFTQGYGNSTNSVDDLPYPIVCKSLNGSRGEGNSLVKSQEELEKWMRGKTLTNYIFERFYSYSSEYRLHIANDYCFYACRKLLKTDADRANSWQRHDDNCVWIIESNPQFEKPDNWNEIVKDCVRARKSLGLDICAFDVKMQKNVDHKGRRRENVEWIVIESCSAPSFGDITLQKYLEEIPKILKLKYNGISN